MSKDLKTTRIELEPVIDAKFKKRAKAIGMSKRQYISHLTRKLDTALDQKPQILREAGVLVAE